MCHVGFFLTDDTETMCVTVFSPDVEKLIGYNAGQLKESDEKNVSLINEIEAVVYRKPATCFVKYFDKNFRGNSLRTYLSRKCILILLFLKLLFTWLLLLLLLMRVVQAMPVQTLMFPLLTSCSVQQQSKSLMKYTMTSRDNMETELQSGIQSRVNRLKNKEKECGRCMIIREVPFAF